MAKRSNFSKKSDTRVSKKRRIKYKKIVIFLVILLLIVLSIYLFFQLRITNIYISNNYYLSDQDIIEIAEISDYPAIYKANFVSIKNKLKRNQLIKNAKVTQKMFTSIYIDVTENRPIFYDSNKEKTILLDESETSEKYYVPNVINYIPDTIYSKFLDNMLIVDIDVLERISEIKYDPNDVDSERFLLFMNDGNYVYLTLDRFNNINSYIDIIKKFGNKKGILYLDSGEYFEVLKGD